METKRSVGELSLRVDRAPAPVRSQVVDKLRRAIIEQRFAIGERLRERELCELTGVSRTSVREALRQLEAEELIEMIPNRGPVVARVSPQTARDLYQVRVALEGLAGRLCALNASPEQLAELARVAAQIRDEVAGGRGDRLVRLKDEFYTALFAGAGNVVAERVTDSLRARVTVLRGQTMSQPGRAEQTVTEIDEIVQAVQARDPDRAERACQAHVESAAALAAELLDDHSHDRDAQPAIRRAGEERA